MRGIDVTTAQDDSADNLADPAFLDRATILQRVLFTFDDDVLSEATRRQRERIAFPGVIYAHPLRISIGNCVNNLEMIAKAGEPEDLTNRVMFLPI